MGCWQETCALTHIPIYEGDKCVIVVMDEIFTSIYRKNHKHPKFESEMELKHIELIQHGTYNEQGWIMEIDNPIEKIKGINRTLSQRRITIFFHEEVWDAALKVGKKEIDFVKKHIVPTLENRRKNNIRNVIDLYVIAQIAYWTRRDLMICEQFHGSQSWENHYYEDIHRLTEEMFKTKVLDKGDV